jgi:hypothetical protein
MECRKASKADSQKRWVQKPENQNYFSGPDNVKRVQEWRKAHPGYWRSNRSCNESALQDSSKTQLAVLVGLISHFTGSALQDDIAFTLCRMQQLGNDILYKPNKDKGENYGFKTSYLSASHTKGSGSVQLGGSSPGP